MFLKRRTRTCDSACESLRDRRDRVVQRQVLHLRELPPNSIPGSLPLTFCTRTGSVANCASSRTASSVNPNDPDVVEVNLASFAAQSPRRFGDRGAATQLWEDFGLHTFWPMPWPTTLATCRGIKFCNCSSSSVCWLQLNWSVPQQLPPRGDAQDLPPIGLQGALAPAAA